MKHKADHRPRRAVVRSGPNAHRSLGGGYDVAFFLKLDCGHTVYRDIAAPHARCERCAECPECRERFTPVSAMDSRNVS